MLSEETKEIIWYFFNRGGIYRDDPSASNITGNMINLLHCWRKLFRRFTSNFSQKPRRNIISPNLLLFGHNVSTAQFRTSSIPKFLGRTEMHKL